MIDEIAQIWLLYLLDSIFVTKIWAIYHRSLENVKKLIHVSKSGLQSNLDQGQNVIENLCKNGERI